ncbi:MAG: chloride channel protein [Candidatus Protistobacter heckmanni]|nr:chloride channel protein [Candidatus Protistobacter heckmanni]
MCSCWCCRACSPRPRARRAASSSPASWACLIAALAWFSQGATLGTGYQSAHALLNGQPLGNDRFGAGKFLATVFSYAAGIPGGIFTPSLAIGAGVGQHIGLLFPGHAPMQILVLLSMTAFLAAATQAPITACVIVMEMTQSQDAFLYLMAAALLTSVCSKLDHPEPFYRATVRRLSAPRH